MEILLTIGIATAALIGIGIHFQVSRHRKRLLGNREQLSDAELIRIFDAENNYSDTWLLEILTEVGIDASIHRGYLRPTDRFDKELRVIRQLEFNMQFDWLKPSLRESIPPQFSIVDLLAYVSHHSED